MTESKGRASGVRTVAFFLILVLLVGMAHARNQAWHTLLSLWQDAAAKSPAKSRVRNNLGNCYLLSRKPFAAIEEYRKAIALDANNFEAYYNLAENLENVGIMNQALYYYELFCRKASSDYSVQKRTACERVATLSKSMKGAGR